MNGGSAECFYSSRLERHAYTANLPKASVRKLERHFTQGKRVFVPILTYGHESWVMTEKNILSTSGRDGISRRVDRVTLRDKMHNCEIPKALNIEQLLRIKKSQLRLFGLLTTISQKILARQILLAAPTAKRPRSRPRTGLRDYISHLAWSHLGVESTELSDIAENHEVFGVTLGLLPVSLLRGEADMKMNEWVEVAKY